MNKNKNHISTALSRVCWREFTIVLFHITFEVPTILDGMLMKYFPDVGLNVEAIKEVLTLLRPIGYLALTTTILLIALGFIIRKSFLSFLGSIALYIPTFGYFAYAMFFLAGLGS